MALTSDAAGAAREGAEYAAEGARSLVAEFFETMRAAAYGILDEQKARAAKEVSDIAEALRSAARSLEQSDNGAAARYVEGAAGGIDRFAEVVRVRSWDDIFADAESLAQRQPALFVCGAIAAGFTAGWLASLPAAGSVPGATREAPVAPYGAAETRPPLSAAAVGPEPKPFSATADEAEPRRRPGNNRRTKDGD